MTDSEKLRLIREVYLVVLENTNTFNGPTGGTLAYIIGAISNDTQKQPMSYIGRRTQMAQILKANFSDGHAVWQFVRLA